MSTILIASGLLAFIGTVFFTGVYRTAAIKQGIIDTPDHRSSHTQPTPTGGGVVAVITILALWLVGHFVGLLTTKETIALVMPGALIALVGFLDDRKPLAKRWRFGAQIISAITVIALLYPLPALPIWGEFALNLNHWPLPFVALAMVWLINLYNFMDGIDGLAGSEAVTVLGAVAIILALAGNTNLAILLALTAVPMLGFLVWNWPPAKIFMGDACSTFLGLSFGTLAFITSKDAQITPWVWVIMLSAFWVDATYTLVVRMVTGQDWRSPHRTHLYQKLARSKQDHVKATLLYVGFSLAIATVTAYVTLAQSKLPLFPALITLAISVHFCTRFRAGLTPKN
ncbi:MraY family glycosyltransferase [Halioxenophilus aromaticivorans]|uniref:Glycosyltransferase family 4 protein n=1 Tax=Halioxenophilus aromaticivorans TaxID=1306992 RepID=A0AAV3TZY7_9ALTE